jgi:hypothetical protein
VKNRLFFALALVALGLISAVYLVIDGGPGALALTIILALIALMIFRYFAEDKPLITTIFLTALAARLAFGLFVQIYDLRDFFGGDANTYDFFGNELLLRWTGAVTAPNPFVDNALQNVANAWGMYHLVASIYYLVGRNILAAQSVCGVIGAATAPMVYICAKKLFANEKVAIQSAVLVALFPAFIIWSAQLLKDGPIVLLLVVIMTMILQLQDRITIGALVLLAAACAGVMSLRFYIFYMVIAAIAASFVIGLSTSAQSLGRNAIVVVTLGLGLTYFGVSRSASTAFEKYADLSAIQTSRQDLATSASSGFGADVDVSTTEGALSAVPTGFAYLFLAPFPWQVTSFRASITLPEVLVWWAMLPLLVGGVMWSIRERLRRAFPILVFTLLLSLAYSIFQGNVGTAYRQRTQIQVFAFIFIAVGWTLRKEKQENDKILKDARKRLQLAAARRKLIIRDQVG